ncbi:MAG TPA: DUF1015 domain-containing protein [Candidatus Dormibacteraeota bacterium]|nr:DUF1015 domain-containing protein [Candidatus Dormibacteraeota bacterium]
MADVRPFRALRYAEPLAPVVAPPHDVLSEEQVAEHRARSPHSVVRLTRANGDSAGAGALLREWVASGVLVRDDQPAMYVHRTEFDGRVRLDVLAVLRLVPYEERGVLPHQRTRHGPEDDRLPLLRATGACLEPLWFLAEELRPLLDAAPDGEERSFALPGERHVVRRVVDPDWLAAVGRHLADRAVLIADGHQQYETTLAYSHEVDGAPDAAVRFTLAALTDLSDPGLQVLPTHRVLDAGVAVTGGEPVGSLDELVGALRGRVAAGTYRAGKFEVLPLEGEVPVVELHRQVIDNVLGKRSLEDHVTYTRDAREAVRWVDSGRGVAAFFLAEPDLAAVLRAARAGMTMPQETTYFHPKLPSGMVFHTLDCDRNP